MGGGGRGGGGGKRGPNRSGGDSSGGGGAFRSGSSSRGCCDASSPSSVSSLVARCDHILVFISIAFIKFKSCPMCYQLSSALNFVSVFLPVLSR